MWLRCTRSLTQTSLQAYVGGGGGHRSVSHADFFLQTGIAKSTPKDLKPTNDTKDVFVSKNIYCVADGEASTRLAQP